MSGQANVRTGGRRAGAPPDGKPTATDKWIPYWVAGNFLLSGTVLLVIGIIGASTQGVLTGLFIIALGIAGYFILRKVSDDTEQ